jgi:tRNA(Arg) A34 adenosine deaminase TadA
VSARHAEIASADPLRITLPPWIADAIDPSQRFDDDESKVGLAIHLAHENVERGTGGPFGAAIFEERSGRLVSVGVNLVAPLANSVLHAEIVAIMFAQRAVGTFTLNANPPHTRHVLATSCAPCAMCLGAVHWSGLSRVLIGATRDDAMSIGFDEGPVFPESIAYLERNGIGFVDGIARERAIAVLQRYVDLGRPIYNG